jgi:dCMP deaminase
MTWSRYFLDICNTVSSNSACLSRQICAVIVRDKAVVSTGYNGPPRGVHHCGGDRVSYDINLRQALQGGKHNLNICPRRLLGFGSGEGLHLCPATHAEANAIVQAARLGVNINHTTMYMNCEVPCKNCLGLIINAGISKIVCTSNKFYDDGSKFIIESSGLEVSTFDMEG